MISAALHQVIFFAIALFERVMCELDRKRQANLSITHNSSTHHAPQFDVGKP